MVLGRSLALICACLRFQILHQKSMILEPYLFTELMQANTFLIRYYDFNLQISAKHGSNDDIVGEQKFRSIKLILTVYFDLSVKSFSTGRTSAVGFLKFTMSCVVIFGIGY